MAAALLAARRSAPKLTITPEEVLHVANKSGVWVALLLGVGIVPFVLLSQAYAPPSSTMAKLPSFASVQALSVTTFEGAGVPASQLYAPNGAVFFVIRRMG